MKNRIKMESTKVILPSRFSIRACFAAALVLLSCSLSYGADVTWTGNVSNAWENNSNWNPTTGPADTDYIYISAGTVNFSSSSGTSASLRGFRQTGGTLNISGGTLEVANLASAYSSFDSNVVQTGGIATINAVQIGGAGGTNGSYTLDSGELRIARARNGFSFFIGGNTGGSTGGVGSMTVSGGSLVTRSGVKLGHATSAGTGSFTVNGRQASVIGIGGGNDDIDGTWEQNTGSSLIVRFDAGGCTPIFVQDNSGTTGTSATFANGTILDVDHLTGDGGGTWTVMEVENGEIDDQGLAFAPGVDTSIWSFTVDNSGPNGKLLVTAIGDPVAPFGYDLAVGLTKQQKMRYGMDYERLWYWTGGLNASERDLIAKWSAIDTRIDYIRVAMNSAYELEEGTYNLSAYTSKIIPMMQEMKDANPDIKFFASPRPLNEAYPNKKWNGTDVRWQPYPIWVTGATTPISGDFDFNDIKCGEYIERYLLLMKSYGFDISFLDLSNEWQSNVAGGRITQADARDVTEYLKASTALINAGIEVPLFVGPSSWNYSQGGSWISNLNTPEKRAAIDIASGHNTDRTGSAQAFADDVHDLMAANPDWNPEIWNTEVHGWKSTSSENETTSFYYMLEKIRAGFSGLNGWLAIGTTNQGHTYILNPNGTPTRNVKYFIFKKLSETSNYGHNLDILFEPSQLSHTAALIKGNLMTVWVINQGTSDVPINITPVGRAISESTVKRTRWTDPSDVEGFVTHEPVTSSASLWSSIPGESVCCFEVLLEPEDHPYTVIQAEDADIFIGMSPQLSGDDDGTLNLGNITNNNWAQYNDVTLVEDSAMRFRVARPEGRADGWVEVYLGAPGASSASILAGTPVGKVAVPVTGDWQVYETIEACIESAAGDYDVILQFVEVGSTSNGSLFNLNSFSIVSPDPPAVPGDFDFDGDVDADDIEFYAGNIGQPAVGELEPLDLDLDGTITLADHNLLVNTLVETTLGVGTLIGDIDLDGDVDILGDAAALINSLGNSGTDWFSGDLNADNQTDILGDAALLINNLFK